MQQSRVFLPPAGALKKHIWVCHYSRSRYAGEAMHPEEKWNKDQTPSMVGCETRSKS